MNDLISRKAGRMNDSDTRILIICIYLLISNLLIALKR